MLEFHEDRELVRAAVECKSAAERPKENSVEFGLLLFGESDVWERVSECGPDCGSNELGYDVRGDCTVLADDARDVMCVHGAGRDEFVGVLRPGEVLVECETEVFVGFSCFELVRAEVVSGGGGCSAVFAEDHYI